MTPPILRDVPADDYDPASSLDDVTKTIVGYDTTDPGATPSCLCAECGVGADAPREPIYKGDKWAGATAICGKCEKALDVTLLTG